MQPQQLEQTDGRTAQHTAPVHSPRRDARAHRTGLRAVCPAAPRSAGPAAPASVPPWSPPSDAAPPGRSPARITSAGDPED
ncbi:hypothetical protein KSNIM_29935, partial [Kitasatospora sp. DSM 101779]|nr:hypothetical protein [Kitasatospora sp. DSM 101779]